MPVSLSQFYNEKKIIPGSEYIENSSWSQRLDREAKSIAFLINIIHFHYRCSDNTQQPKCFVLVLKLRALNAKGEKCLYGFQNNNSKASVDISENIFLRQPVITRQSKENLI